MSAQIVQEVRLRKQGGATVMAVPAPALKALCVGAEDTVRITVSGGRMVVEALKPKVSRKRYRLDELLRGASPKAMKSIHDDTRWFRDAPPVGREAK